MTSSTALNQTWRKIRRWAVREPLRLRSLVTTLIAVATAAGLQVSDETAGALSAIAVGVAALLGDHSARKKVTPVADPDLPDGHHVPGDPDPADG